MKRLQGAILFILLAVVFPQGEPAAQATSPKLNFLFLLADDLGWSNLGSYGNDFIQTPHLDRLARQGVRFTNAYAASPVCAPTQASILTGLNPNRIGMFTVRGPEVRPWARLIPPASVYPVPDNLVTIADVLAEAGYVSTCIDTGKWGLSSGRESSTAFGFSLPPAAEFAPGRRPRAYDQELARFASYPHKNVGADTLRAVRFLEENRDRPFFCFLPYVTPHLPIDAREDLIASYRSRAAGRQTEVHPGFAAMVETVDQSVGLLMSALEELGLADNTVVFFFSDNGGVMSFSFEDHLVTVQDTQGNSRELYAVDPDPTYYNSNRPLRGQKGTLYEGGIRVPLIVRWPGVTAPDTTCPTPVISDDFFPTLAEMAGISRSRLPDLDGRSLVSLLQGRRQWPREALHWYFPYYHNGPPAGAIRWKDYKLVELLDEDTRELYDLEADPGERHNLEPDLPDLAARLRDQWHAWRRSVGAPLPGLNPAYDPARARVWDRPRLQRVLRDGMVVREASPP